MASIKASIKASGPIKSAKCAANTNPITCSSSDSPNKSSNQMSPTVPGLIDVQLIVLIYETRSRQYEGHNTPLGYHILTKARRAEVSIMAKGSTASEVFLNFTTQLYTYLCYYNPILTRG